MIAFFVLFISWTSVVLGVFFTLALEGDEYALAKALTWPIGLWKYSGRLRPYTKRPVNFSQMWDDDLAEEKPRSPVAPTGPSAGPPS